MNDLLFWPFSWLIAGLMLGIIELLLPGFVFVGMGVAALIIGIVLFPLGDFLSSAEYGPHILLVLFGLLSLVVWAILRRLLGLRDRQEVRFDKDINELD